MNVNEHDNEGRILTAYFGNFTLVNTYVPNSGEFLKRLDYRTNRWDLEYIKYLKKISKINEYTIVCGDLNVAHNEIDVHSPKRLTNSAGFTKRERDNFNKLLNETKLIDSYRYFQPEKEEYTYWSYLNKSRKNNKGWRIDYFLVNKKLLEKIKESKILTKHLGSDHAPIILEI